MENKKTELIKGATNEELIHINHSEESVILNAPTDLDITKDTDSIQLGSEIELSCETENLFVRILEVISEPGKTREGCVYKVEDRNKNILALKVYQQLRPEDEPNPVALERVRKIRSPSILPLIEYGVGKHKIHGKHCWELQVYAEGGNLLSVRDIKSKYTYDFIEQVLIPQLLNGLWSLHDKGIYHCDLKPQNVFYLDNAQTNIVIGDYGSAKTKEVNISDSFIFSKRIVGTHTYIPPEFHEGFIKDNSDYFSMGMIILELLYHESFAEDPARVKESISLRRNRQEPIFNFQPKYERLNKLIEGCTLASWDRRWTRSDITEWQKGHIAPIIYRDTRVTQELKISRQVSVKTIDEFVNYGWSLSPDKFYSILIEDEAVFSHTQNWIFDILSADDARSFMQIRNVYGLKGKYQLKEAFLRFIEPMLPLACNGKLFKFEENPLPAVVRNYFQELLHSGMQDNPRILEQLVFTLEYTLLMLIDSEIDSKKKEASNIYSIMRFILVEKETHDSILGMIANCDEQTNDEFYKQKIKLLNLCIEKYIESDVASVNNLTSLVRDTINSSGLKQDLMIHGVQRNFSSDELTWWLRLIDHRLHELITTCSKTVYNEKDIASRIICAFFDIDPKADAFLCISHDVKELDDKAQEMNIHDLIFELNILLTKLHGWAKILNNENLELIKRLLDCVPNDYQKPERYLSWGNSIPNPAITIIQMAWICDPRRGIRADHGKIYEDLTSFLLDFVYNRLDKDAIWWEICEYCNIKRGTEKKYSELFDLLIDSWTFVDNNKITHKLGKDFKITDLTMRWQDGFVSCRVSIHSSLTLICEHDGKRYMRHIYRESMQNTQEISIKKAVCFGKKSRSGTAANMNNEKGYQALEEKIMQAAVGKSLPTLEESNLHDDRLKKIKKHAEIVGNGYKTHLRHKHIENSEARKALYTESFRWLSMALIIPLIWIVYSAGADTSPSLIPLFLYGIPLIVIIGALPYFHQKRFKWSIILSMSITALYAIYNGYDDLHKLLIMLSWLKYLILYIVAVHLQSFFGSLREYYIKARVVSIAVFIVLGFGSILSIALNAWAVKPLLFLGPSEIDNNSRYIRIAGGQVSFQDKKIRLDPYFIAKHETTINDYRSFVLHSNYKTEAETGAASLVFSNQGLIYNLLNRREATYDTDASWWNPNIKQSDNHPVVCISFKDALYYCNWLSGKEGYSKCYQIYKNRIYCDWEADGYRLPTEAEWEWAASESSSDSSKNDSKEMFFPVAWFLDKLRLSTKPVMMKNPNTKGVYDMYGNVSEWCWDLYQKKIPSRLPDNYRGPTYGNYRCVRGGSWCRDGNIKNAQTRNKNAWEKDGKSLTSAAFIGFRIVRKAQD